MFNKKLTIKISFNVFSSIKTCLVAYKETYLLLFCRLQNFRYAKLYACKNENVSYVD